MATGGAYSWGGSGDPSIREDLLDFIMNITPSDNQLVSGLGVSSCDAQRHEWLR